MSKPERPPGNNGSQQSSSQAKKPCLFYKLMVASNIHDRNLRIPNKFVKKYGEGLSAVGTLVLPSGESWLVRLRKVDHKLWFTDGWHDFVVYYSICAGCLLLFNYEGDSKFNVSIFNLTAYEMDYKRKTLGKETEHQGPHRNGIDTSQGAYFNFRSNVNGKCLDQKLLCGNCNATLNSMSTTNESKKPFLSNDADSALVRPQSTQSASIQFKGSELAEVESHDQAEARRTRQRSEQNEPVESPSTKITSNCLDFSGKKRDTTTEGRERAFRLAEMFKPANPHCRIILRPTFISNNFLHIPAGFASKFSHKVYGDITLQDSYGNSWPVRCILNRHATKLSQGWAQFVKDNHLEEGDVCVFELLDRESVVLKVTIFRL